jgi:hypothetical protein
MNRTDAIAAAQAILPEARAAVAAATRNPDHSERRHIGDVTWKILEPRFGFDVARDIQSPLVELLLQPDARVIVTEVTTRGQAKAGQFIAVDDHILTVIQTHYDHDAGWLAACAEPTEAERVTPEYAALAERTAAEATQAAEQGARLRRQANADNAGGTLPAPDQSLMDALFGADDSDSTAPILVFDDNASGDPPEMGDGAPDGSTNDH